jgi:hypothetical protein
VGAEWGLHGRGHAQAWVERGRDASTCLSSRDMDPRIAIGPQPGLRGGGRRGETHGGVETVPAIERLGGYKRGTPTNQLQHLQPLR